MKLKDFKIVVLLIFCNASLYAQYKVSGTVTSKENNIPINGVEIYNKAKGKLSVTNDKGYYEFTTYEKQLEIVFFSYEYNIEEEIVNLAGDIVLNKQLSAVEIELTEVEVVARKAQIFNLKRLEDVVGTSIYAGKKTEVVLVSESVANLASNNARQIYSQVVGLNIFQNDDAGLQLNIGGRGLDPNRTSNFNTRQNGYDISADVLGYPESYYTPPAEALEEIQIIRGAASLQYGTQFGGLVNFITKKPNPTKEIEVLTRNTIGSNNLYTNYTSVNGTKNKVSYYASFNFKEGDGFRPNSHFNSKNAFLHLGYQLNAKTKLEAEITYLDYLAQQAGGLTDAMFAVNPYQSNRARNWFAVNWLLYNIQLKHKFTENASLSFSFFGLNASRDALGFRTNRVDQVDTNEERDLITGDFKNFGFETKFLNKYSLFGKKATYLVGAKFYKANNTSVQGPGTNGSGANFSSAISDYPNYPSQSNYKNPNLNVAFFAENILYIKDNWSVTPGVRVEYIKTESDGFFKNINTDAAGNVILNETVESSDSNTRSFVLFGLGSSYKLNSYVEIYGNASQNYRSVTFSDLNIVNPSFRIGDLSDEKGYTLDLGFRGNYKNYISYDAGVFGLLYNDRIGLVTKALDDGSVVQERTNVGDARIVGVESLVDFNLKKILKMNSNFSFNYFINSSIINSEYTKSEQNGIKGKSVEFVPDFNFKTGIKFGYKNVLSSIQYTSLTEQFTDATNSREASLSGVNGVLPEYNVLDVSLSYTYKFLKLETGINNVLDNEYFTRRATGYPGPGIIPSSNRNYYATLQVKF
ncbi:TonB-dependent receptor [Cellulophaga sp. 20_2_10]|uniref:TonB-dependent receptor domain-containing protein n=1 Tax=Cellulophaga sp. 20_2_10 TaxID=2942476 RepID=UPI00201B2BBB|nr:TonB-dependent receptor [Cellulophaga sp. 20_2_10]MCL5246025.1 TonB-dependent receptor [Cellulophaga sp. 20_2_10]